MNSPVLSPVLSPILYLSCISFAHASWFDDIGYTALQAELGLSAPDGAGILVGVAEPEFGAPDHYTPDSASTQFSGKTITDVTGTSAGISGHANTVSTRFFGNTGSIASGITDVNFYNANDYLQSGGLQIGSNSQPTIFSEKIMNHSYIVANGFVDNGGTPLPALTSEALKRFDYSLARDNTLAVVGLNNGSGSTIPQLLAHNYNGISVGLTNGNHSTGATTIEGLGRVKPDLVAPDSATSYATPMVSASAAVLLSSSHSTANYEQITSQKAVLLAGATKEGKAFEGSWSRTSAKPLDAHYGAGEVNILNSHTILAAGEKTTGATDLTGWDYASISGSTANTYVFTVNPSEALTEFSAALTWNREVNSVSFASASLSDLNLELRDSDGNLIQSSTSSVDNIEHLYINPGIEGAALSADTYSLTVSSASGDADYSLAWRSELTAVPEPSTSGLCFLASSLLLMRRRR